MSARPTPIFSTASIAGSTRSTFGQPRAARPDERQRLAGSAVVDRAHDVDARDERAEIIGRPAHEGEDAVRRKAQDAAAAIDNRLARLVAEADPTFDAAFDPSQLDPRQHGADIARRRACGVRFGSHKGASICLGKAAVLNAIAERRPVVHAEPAVRMLAAPDRREPLLRNKRADVARSRRWAPAPARG